MPPKPSKWKAVADKDVRHVWQCLESDCEEQPTVNVTPDSYQDVGEPLCPHCDSEMQYVRTEIRQ